MLDPIIANKIMNEYYRYSEEKEYTTEDSFSVLNCICMYHPRVSKSIPDLVKEICDKNHQMKTEGKTHA